MIFLAGPGHGAPGVLAPIYLEGTYSEIYPEKSQDEKGLREFFKQFSFPGGIGSHCTPETPGSIHEGGELGYASLMPAERRSTIPELIVAAVVGMAKPKLARWRPRGTSANFCNPIRDGAVLPILHLNGTRSTTRLCWRGSRTRNWKICCAGTAGLRTLWRALTTTACTRQWRRRWSVALPTSGRIRKKCRKTGIATRPRWPMVVLRSPKGWGAPAEVDGHRLEGFWRSHQVPLADVKTKPEQSAHSRELDAISKPEEFFDETGKLRLDLAEFAPLRFAPHERQPARERRAQEETPVARVPRLRRQNRAAQETPK